MAATDTTTTLVVDLGSGTTKAGFGGDDAPRAVFPSVIGRPRGPTLVGMGPGLFAGDSALSKRGILNLNYPIRRGIVTNWEEVEKLLHYTFYDELRVEPSDFTVLISRTPFNPESDRERMATLLFEQFSVPGFALGIEPLLALYSCGKSTGTSVVCGEGVTQIVPIYENLWPQAAVIGEDIAGCDITNHLAQLLPEAPFAPYPRSSGLIVRDIKEKLGYVALDYAVEKGKTDSEIQKQYELPDGEVISVGHERFTCVEGLFQPQFILGRNSQGLHKSCFNSIMKCDEEIHAELFRNIMLFGGSTMFQGIAERMTKEMVALAPTRTIKVSTPPERKYGVWIGGSALSSMDSFSAVVIDRSEYDESGPSIVLNRNL
ncbi:actin 7 [Pelomyxa schiedti]|nr:actin 7 [Pelomyxa schiedti]